MLQPHLAVLKVLKNLCATVQLRAIALLAVGQSEDALKDGQLLFDLGDSIRTEPLLISYLVRIDCVSCTTALVWEGLERHQWTEPQLAELEANLAKIDLFADYAHAMRGERAFGNVVFDRLQRGENILAGGGDFGSGYFPFRNERTLHMLPRGWLYQDELLINRLYQERTLLTTDAARHRIYLRTESDVDYPAELRRLNPYNVVTRILFAAPSASAWRCAYQQTVIDQARAAGALERHRLATGKLPESLNVLVPRFLDRVPNDVVDGQPLRYRRTADDEFVLYSVGRDGIDNGGKIIWNKTHTTRNNDEGDWVW